MGILLYPYFLIVFWYKDFFLSCVRICIGIFIYAANLLSVPLLLKKFFKPLKNEYREGLVFFSIIMGVIIKIILLAVTIAILIPLGLMLFAICAGVLLLPAILVLFIFRK